jgi:hypothetical protein
MEHRGGGHEGEKKRKKRKDKVKRKGHDSLELFLGIKSSSILISNTTQLGFSSEFGAKTFWKNVDNNRLLLRNVNLARLDIIADVLGAASINLASDGKRGAQDLKNATTELLGKTAGAHGASNLNDLIERDGLGVLDVLLLLAVTGRLLESTDDEGRSGGNNRDRGLTVLDGELDGDTETFPVTGSLGNIFTNFLGRQTQRTDLGGKCRLSTNLTTGGTEVDDLHLIGVEFGRHGEGA